MPSNNQILPFAQQAQEVTGDLESQETYVSDDVRISGNKIGKARRNVMNKVLKQTSLVAASVAQVVADKNQQEVTDTMTVEQLAEALGRALGQLGYDNIPYASEIIWGLTQYATVPEISGGVTDAKSISPYNLLIFLRQQNYLKTINGIAGDIAGNALLPLITKTQGTFSDTTSPATYHGIYTVTTLLDGTEIFEATGKLTAPTYATTKTITLPFNLDLTHASVTATYELQIPSCPSAAGMMIAASFTSNNVVRIGCWTKDNTDPGCTSYGFYFNIRGTIVTAQKYNPPTITGTISNNSNSAVINFTVPPAPIAPVRIKAITTEPSHVKVELSE